MLNLKFYVFIFFFVYFYTLISSFINVIIILFRFPFVLMQSIMYIFGTPVVFQSMVYVMYSMLIFTLMFRIFTKFIGGKE